MVFGIDGPWRLYVRMDADVCDFIKDYVRTLMQYLVHLFGLGIILLQYE